MGRRFHTLPTFSANTAVNENLSRRDFINRSSLVPLAAGASLALGLAPGASPAHAAATPIKRVGGPKLKMSLNAYSFSKPLNDHIKGRGAGHDAVRPAWTSVPSTTSTPSTPPATSSPAIRTCRTDKYINDFKRRSHQLGLDISGTGIRNDFAQADAAKRAADVQHCKEWVEVAAKLGAPVLRVFAGLPPEGHAWDEAAKWMADDLRKCAEFGEQYGVLIGVQNHGDMLKTADDVIKIVDDGRFGLVRRDRRHRLLHDAGPVRRHRQSDAVRSELPGEGKPVRQGKQRAHRPGAAGENRSQGRLPRLFAHRDAVDPRSALQPQGTCAGVSGGAADGAGQTA